MAVGLAVLIGVVALSSGGSGTEGTSDRQPTPQSQVKPIERVPKEASAKPQATTGRTPDRPAPSLTEGTMASCRALLAEAKTLYNEAQKARQGKDTGSKLSAGRKAKAKLDEITHLLEEPLGWQEEAEMEDWTQPGPYVALQRFFVEYSTLKKKVRMLIGS